MVEPCASCGDALVEEAYTCIDCSEPVCGDCALPADQHGDEVRCPGCTMDAKHGEPWRRGGVTRELA